MSAMLTTLPGTTTSVDDVVAVIEADGGVIVAGLADGATLDGLWRDLGPRLSDVGWGQDDFSGARTRRVSAIFARTRHAVPILTHPLFLGAAERFLQVPVHTWVGDECTETVASIQVGGTQAIQIHPGQPAQPLHRDDLVFQWRHPTFGREARVQMMLALSDFTVDNGGTLVVPGSHRWDDDRAPDTAEAVATEMRAGSALLFLGSTYHGGGANRSTTPRTGLTITLDLGFLRQEENQYLSVPLDVVRQYPERVQRLLGYNACPPLMGWVEINGQMNDPHVVLEEWGDEGPAVNDMFETR
ncbi:MAG: phytanoyl-CoA dioxygenase family protein [Actinobacteria bacterium]|nr:phytanoyl-CoA dioxygenase family protein [Actinomycetota bacterium]